MKRCAIKRRPSADTVLDKLEPEATDYRELDGNGLYFQVKKTGHKASVLRYKRPCGKWLDASVPGLSVQQRSVSTNHDELVCRLLGHIGSWEGRSTKGSNV